MEKKILVATHGKMASGLQSSINVLTNAGDKLKVIDAYVTDEDYTPQITEFIDSVGPEEQGFIFTDLYGGSVNQKVVTELMKSNPQNIFLFSNSNLAIVLSVMFTEEDLTAEKIQQLIKESQLRLVSTELDDDDEDDEDDEDDIF